MIASSYRFVEYMCTHCGRKEMRAPQQGRPQPGRCTGRPAYANGTPKPHTWVINRKIK